MYIIYSLDSDYGAVGKYTYSNIVDMLNTGLIKTELGLMFDAEGVVKTCLKSEIKDKSAFF